MKKLRIELPAALHLSRQAIKRHLDKENAPQPDAAGKYDVAAVKRFVECEQRQSRGYATGDLLAAKVEKLKLECRELRQKMHLLLPAIPVSEIEKLLWNFLNELNKEQMAVVNSVGIDLVGKTAVADIYRILRPVMLEIQSRLAAWCRVNAIPIRGGEKFAWPVEGHPSFNTVKRVPSDEPAATKPG